MSRPLEDDISWKVIETYFKEGYLKQLIRHQLESYNNFIHTQIFSLYFQYLIQYIL